MGWPRGEKALNGIFDIFNNHKPTIIFRAKLHKQKLVFLDIIIFKDPENENGLLTKVFFKTTDTHQFLHKDSVHPKHTKNY